MRLLARPEPAGIHLARLRVASPCPADWEKMIGDERMRHCAECNLNVYNLSAMTEREAQKLIAEKEGRLCVRFYRRADGTVLTRDCPWSLRRAARRAARLASAALAAIMSAGFAAPKKLPQTGCKFQQLPQKEAGVKITVMDQQSAVIPKAEIALVDKSGKTRSGGLTGPEGVWNQTKLAAGEYDLSIKAPGFRTFKGVVTLREGALFEFKIHMPVGNVNTTVEVTADAAVIQGTYADVLPMNPRAIPVEPGGGGQRTPIRP